ncbi:MAG: nitrophenyl compound nitroreductase subunit ArsF family protein [Candidatus Kapabacteria bacterium]|jgi:hypothetical protein|nr:nitrophenyl compound nitroreductase subunit ArsF family protein [Candidatus Kapabacteria bacterium]
MKKLSTLIVLFIVMLGVTSCNKSDSKIQANTEEFKNQTVVYYFHTDRRCKTCMKIEKTTFNLVVHDFAEARKAGKLSFKQFNIDREENLDMAIEFEASGSKLCVVNYDNDGKKTITDLTDFAFSNAFSEEKFEPGIKAAIEKALDANK